MLMFLPTLFATLSSILDIARTQNTTAGGDLHGVGYKSVRQQQGSEKCTVPLA